jgi:hypothetical protein
MVVRIGVERLIQKVEVLEFAQALCLSRGEGTKTSAGFIIVESRKSPMEGCVLGREGLEGIQ